jgi:NAD(P)-dependent dehydrogenase (short-subunit alcohol dehydrogenase family)
VVVGGHAGAGEELVTGLEDLGATVEAIDAEELGGRAQARRLFDDAAQHLGRLDAVVMASVGAAATRGGALAELDAETWMSRVEVPLHRTLLCFQAARRCLREAGGTLILLVPSLSLTGTAGFVPWAAVTEGQRALAKAAARAWGDDAITVNCVAMVGATLRSGPPHSDRIDVVMERPGLPSPALASPDVRTDVAGVVLALISPTWRAVTGATIAVDGGVWMAP